MTNKFKQFIDYFEKFFKRFKVIGYFIVIGFVMFHFIENGFKAKEALKVAEKITGLNLEKDILLKEKKELKYNRDSLITELYLMKEQRDSIIILKEQEAWKSAKYKRERNKARLALKEFIPNESYDYLQEEAYSFTGKKEYGFNEKQVSAIHKTFIENEFNKDIIGSQSAELDHCNDALAMSLESESITDKVSKSFEEEIAVDSSIMVIDEEKTDIAMKQWKKQRRKGIWTKTKTWVFAIGGFIGGVLIAK